MDRIELRHDIVAKMGWIFYLTMGLIGLGFIVYCLWLAVHFWGEWQAGASTVSASLALVPTCLAIYIASQQLFVWSHLTIEADGIAQRLLRQERKVNLSCPFEQSYTFGLTRTSELRQPLYQWLEIRQGDVVIRFMPRRLTPKVDPDVLPENLRAIWQAYSRKASWGVLPSRGGTKNT